MTLNEINKRIECIKHRRNEGKMTLVDMAKHLDTMDRLKAKI